MLKNLIVVKHLTDNILLVCDANQSDSVLLSTLGISVLTISFISHKF